MIGVNLNRYPTSEQVEAIRSKYHEGATVMLDHMDDVQAPPVGTTGTVRLIDDIGQIHVDWANGSGLALIPGVDRFHIVEMVVYNVYAMDCYLDESGWVENDRCRVGTIRIPKEEAADPDREKRGILSALTKLDVKDITGIRSQKALTTTDPNLVDVDDYYDTGEWLEVVSVRADRMPLYGIAPAPATI